MQAACIKGWCSQIWGAKTSFAMQRVWCLHARKAQPNTWQCFCCFRMRVVWGYAQVGVVLIW